MNQTWDYGDDAPPAPSRGFPWPPAEDEPVLTAFGETWKGATFDPGAFFGRVPRDRGTGAALLYFMAIGVLVAGTSLFWDSLALFGGALEGNALAAELGIEPGSPLVGFLLTPAILLVSLFVSAGVVHVLLALFDGAGGGFGTTVRVFCYAYSPGLFGVIPFLGGLVGSIWMVVLLVIGLREAHDADGWKAGVAVLVPFVLLTMMMILGFLVLMATSAALLESLGG